ncbi:MAG: hypothetical protein E7370_06220 [Clostridiales bacterium]|nr:hypothetical protein [Clostridiales bacterium]
MNNQIVISTPPHVKCKSTTKSIMLDVLISLAPATVMAIVYFGLNALWIVLTAVLGAVATEFVYYFIAQGGFANKCKNALDVCKKWWKQFDYTSAITGLILALILPSTAIWYEVLIGAIFSIAIVKMLFGGTGKNLVNPAAMGRVFMFISFAIAAPVVCNIAPILGEGTIATGASALSGNILQGNEAGISYLDLFLGTGVPAAAIGETCKAAIIIGWIYLAVKKVIKWWQPLIYIAVAGLVGALLALTVEGQSVDFINSFLSLTLSGGLIFGAVFMATDYVTSPKATLGQIIYFVVLGLLTAVLRHYTKLEVVSFVIVLVNLIVPLIDRYFIRKPFGYKREKKEVK